MKIIIFTSTCLNTSSGSLPTTLNILDNLPKEFKANLILVDSLVPKSRRVVFEDQRVLAQVLNHSKVSSVNDLMELTIKDIKELGNKAIISIYNYLGEDGILPALCSLCDIDILSTSFSSSVICLDKNWTKQIMIANQIPVPRGLVVNSMDSYKKVLSFFNDCNKKIILKPVACGASRGCNVCENSENIKNSLYNAFNFSDQILCEEFIEGREYTIGFIENNNVVRILPPVEIITEKTFFDYDAKYNDSKTLEICPAETLNESLLSEIHNILKKIISVFKLTSHGRVDFIVSNNRIYILEINTFPGLMENSLFPKELAAANISLKDFIFNAFSK